jgi:cell division septation protein DedD
MRSLFSSYSRARELKPARPKIPLDKRSPAEGKLKSQAVPSASRVAKAITAASAAAVQPLPSEDNNVNSEPPRSQLTPSSDVRPSWDTAHPLNELEPKPLTGDFSVSRSMPHPDGFAAHLRASLSSIGKIAVFAILENNSSSC